MTFEYRKWITREMLRAEPDTVFVFGDNIKRIGMGGQAKEMRGEPNAFGIPTKWSPGMADEDFFTDHDYDFVIPHLISAHTFLKSVDKIVWPADGIGTGLARLNLTAPKIFHAIEMIKWDLGG